MPVNPDLVALWEKSAHFRMAARYDPVRAAEDAKLTLSADDLRFLKERRTTRHVAALFRDDPAFRATAGGTCADAVRNAGVTLLDDEAAYLSAIDASHTQAQLDDELKAGEWIVGGSSG